MKHVIYSLNPLQVKFCSHSFKTIKVGELNKKKLCHCIFLLNFKFLLNLRTIFRACARNRAEAAVFDGRRALPERPRSSPHHSKRNDTRCTTNDIRSWTTSVNTVAGATCCRNDTTCGSDGRIYNSFRACLKILRATQ